MDSKDIILCLVIFLSYCEAQNLINQTCLLENNTIANFDEKKFSGLWYDYKQYKNLPQKERDCETIRFNYLETNNFTVIIKSTDRRNGSNPIKNVYPGILYVEEGKSKNGSYTLQLMINKQVLRSELNVLSTNYNGYAIIWTCPRVNATAPNALILSREKKMNAQNKKIVEEEIAKFKFIKKMLLTAEAKHDCSAASFSSSNLFTTTIMLFLCIVFVKREF